ncbi:prolylcarboxypeptidase-like protein [Citrus sinensis]|uniref:Prolylcarboxypeptidase-like protein n=1 Tax=Citrus sinensis TaxID=2711 RepID=A0ACB8IV79_CITSI|nr:prolylcarboxypeptidase-like protein [Citrus sinensis]
MALQFLFQFLSLLLLFTTICISATYPGSSTRFDTMRRRMTSKSNSHLPPEFVTYYYTQTLDHFNYKPESYATFQQKYIKNFKYWGGASTSSPIIVYIGEEAPLTFGVHGKGFIVDLASRFKAMLLYIEHRYYGDSMPFGSFDEAFRDANTLGFLSSTQALADCAQLITDVKRNLSAENCPVIAIGGSYGGMLASWLRLKYPHIATGALASSAPILYFDDLTPQNGYHVVVTNDFRDVSESCYNTIKQSWSEIDRVAGQTNGLTTLSNIFQTCSPLNSSKELKDHLGMIYVISAQNDNPPYNPVSKVCGAIDGAPKGTDILGKVAAGLNASLLRGGPEAQCNHIIDFTPKNTSGWTWQTCTEMVMPIGHGENDTMFQGSPFDLNNYTKSCQALFGVTPKPHWITTEFGGHDIKSVLGNFSSNIIFSNGLRDPYSVGGVLEDISDSVVAVYTKDGAHGLDLLDATPSDPEWLLAERQKEIKIIELWIAEHNARLIKTGNRIGF